MHITELEPEENTFKFIIADLTHKCNMACSNCYIPNRTIPDMDLEKLYDFARRLPFPVTFRLMGAEPTMVQNLPEVVLTLSKMEHRTTLMTNGLKLADIKLVKELKNAGLNAVQLSMNGGTLDEVYKITDNLDSADLKIRALQNLVACEIPTTVSMVVVSEQINGPAIATLVSLVEDTFDQYSKRKDKAIFIPSIRFRSVGRIGRYMNSEINLTDLKNLALKYISSDLVFRPAETGTDNIKDASGEGNACALRTVYNSKVGQIYIRLVDLREELKVIVDAGNKNRGRITKDWKISPFFEDIQKNENFY